MVSVELGLLMVKLSFWVLFMIVSTLIRATGEVFPSSDVLTFEWQAKKLIRIAIDKSLPKALFDGVRLSFTVL
ncbi:hypothetical protein GCM10009122_61190 [Fulvivirga kasyanovii]